MSLTHSDVHRVQLMTLSGSHAHRCFRQKDRHGNHILSQSAFIALLNLGIVAVQHMVPRSMLERQRDFTPVTASIVDRHVLARGSQDKVVDLMIVC
eukprot:1592164-Amphidinium_carterae.1